jgi:hypothetical protein
MRTSSVVDRCKNLSIEIFDSRQRKNPFVDSSENFHIDTARTRFGRITGRTRTMKAKKTAKKAAAKKKPAKKKKK